MFGRDWRAKSGVYDCLFAKRIAICIVTILYLVLLTILQYFFSQPIGITIVIFLLIEPLEITRLDRQ